MGGASEGVETDVQRLVNGAAGVARSVALALGLLALAGCARGPLLTRTIEPPSMLPLRTFPAVWVAAASDAEGILLADLLVAGLNAAGPVRARHVRLEELEPARLAGRIPAGTAVLRLVLHFEERMDVRASERPETVCGPFGCYQESHRVEYEVPVLAARLEAFVHDGPSATQLARVPMQGQEEGRDYSVMRRRVVRLMAERLMRMIDPEVTTLRARLLRVSVPQLDSVFEAAIRGELAQARTTLAVFLGSDAFEALVANDQAALLYDQAELWRFDPQAGEQGLLRARALLTRAVHLYPRGVYDRALRELAEDEQRRMTREAQRAAAAHNFAIGQGRPPPHEEGAPSPPAGYH